MDDLILILGDEDELSLVMGDSESFELFISDGGSYVPVYTGEYTVKPKLYLEQTLETEGKQMLDDVTVLEIPVTTTSNIYGGKTVVIG